MLLPRGEYGEECDFRKGFYSGPDRGALLLITEALLKSLKPGDEVVEGDPTAKRKGELHRCSVSSSPAPKRTL